MGDNRSFSAGHFVMSLDGTPALLKKFGGGAIKAEVVELNGGPNNTAFKSISTIKFESFTIEVGMSMGKPLYEWIKASLDKAWISKNGYIAAADFKYKAKAYRHFRDAHIEEITVPALDAGNKEAAYFTIKFNPEEITYADGDDADIKGDMNFKQKKWLCSNFKFTLSGLEDSCKRVNKIDSFTVKQSVTEDACGEFRIPTKHPAKLVIPNLKITFSAADVKPWQAWFDDFVIKGNNGQEAEKNGTIEFLDPATKETLGTVQLSQVGIFALNSEDLEANKEGVARYVAELYVEAMQFDLKYV
jgi:hypothetical protein